MLYRIFTPTIDKEPQNLTLIHIILSYKKRTHIENFLFQYGFYLLEQVAGIEPA